MPAFFSSIVRKNQMKFKQVSLYLLFIIVLKLLFIIIINSEFLEKSHKIVQRTRPTSFLVEAE